LIKRILAIVRKEFIHIFRDTRTISVVVFIPIFLLMLFGYALTVDVKHIKTAVIDPDRSSYSRDYVSKFSNSGYFDVDYYLTGVSQVRDLMDRDILSVAIVIPDDFSKKLLSGGKAEVQTIFDGVNSNTAVIARSYTDAITISFWKGRLAKVIERKGLSHAISFNVLKYDPRFWYNPTLESMNFLVPGLICVILMILSALLTSMTIVSEKEKGTIEMLIVSPLKKSELIIGKLIPYIVIAFFDILLVIIIGTFWFGVAIKGNLLLLLLLSFVFLFSALGMGLLISTVANSGQEAYIIAIVTSMLPSIMLSGFHFPIASMPPVLQFVSYLIPARYYLVIIRGIVLKGVGILYLWPNVLALLFFGTVMIALSILRFNRRIG
jgi:ABC-2 type transport system permease protein